MTPSRMQARCLDAEVQDGHEKVSLHLRDFGIFALIGLVTVGLSHLLGLWPCLLQAAARHRQWRLGEILIVMAALSVPLGTFLVLRTRRLRRLAQDRRALEEKLLQKTHELESVFKAFPDLYFRLDSDGTVLDYQAGRLSDLRVEPKALLGRRIEDVLPSGVSRQFHDAIIQLHKTGAASALEYSLPKEEHIQTFEVRFLPFERKQIIAIFRDITERAQADERVQRYAKELADSNEEIRMFAYIVSHDFMSPLASIKGFAGELSFSVEELGGLLAPHVDSLGAAERTRLSELLDKEIPEALSFIGSSVARMDHLTKAILKLSRLERRDLRPESIDTKCLVDSVVKSLAHQIGTGGITVSVGPLPGIIADPTAMEQIFGNLIDNAVKYLDLRRPGVIEVSGEEGDGEVVFRVRDNGRGICPEDAERVFEIFRRAGAQDVPGEGMGLAYVRTLLRRQGGRIWCEPGEGAGTVFAFTLPVSGGQRFSRARRARLPLSDRVCGVGGSEVPCVCAGPCPAGSTPVREHR